MQFQLPIDIPKLAEPIRYPDRIMLVGSCFTEHISERLLANKFSVLSNPNGILFNPLSVSQSIDGYIDGRQYATGDLFSLNELWNSWDHHTRFSHTDADAALRGINESQRAASDFIKTTDWLILTLRSAFQYHLKDSGKPVANNHRAPAQWFEKRLLSIDEIISSLAGTLEKLSSLNTSVQVLFTISPVRHIRDGVVDNNRSKARLIEAVHHLCLNNQRIHYFPAYELVIDVLRDYRFYDVDMVHPNYSGTTYVWEQFVQSCISPASYGLMEQLQDIATARGHRPRFPDTKAHAKFKESYMAKVRALIASYPFLDLKEESDFFGN